MMLRLAAFSLVAALLTFVGCQSEPKKPDYDPLVARLFLETKPSEVGVPAQLPESGVTINVGPKPVIVEYDIVNAEIAQVDLGKCLLLQLTPTASRDLYRLSVSAMGRRLVLSLNDRFFGARRIDQAMADGTILTFVELPEAELPEVVDRLKKTSADIAIAVKKSRDK